mgnify:CR=1 FL=1
MGGLKRPANMRMTLKTAREIAGLTQADAAQRIGVNVDTLGNYERGKSYPDVPTLRAIESTYQVRYDQLIFLPLDFGLTGNNEDKKPAPGV